MKVKICGITRAEDAELAIELGAHYLGFIFVTESPRYVAHPPSTRGVQRVGVFRNASRDEILRTVESARLDLVQIHGPIVDAGVPAIHAFKVGDTLPDTTSHADYVLFDTGGGTGRTFDWSLLDDYPRTKPFFLAGGLTPDNVAEAIARTRPFAVDVASGVERAPGIKDAEKMKRLFEAIHQ
jgi:phosphoribosylanthranilate isomerase